MFPNWPSNFNRPVILVQQLWDAFNVVGINWMTWDEISILKSIVQVFHGNTTVSKCVMTIFTCSQEEWIIIYAMIKTVRCYFSVYFKWMIVYYLSCCCIPHVWALVLASNIIKEASVICCAAIFTRSYHRSQDIFEQNLYQ